MSFIHSLADVRSPRIGKNTKNWQFVVVLQDPKIVRYLDK